MKNELFLTLVKHLEQIKINEDVEIIGEELIYKNEKTFFIHGPSTFIDDIIIKLNYDYDHNNKTYQNFLIDYDKKFLSSFMTFLRIKRDDIFFILLIIIFIIIIFIIRK